MVSSRVAQYDNFDVLDPKQSKFINWVLKFDFDQFVLKAHGLLVDSSVSCNFCRFLPSDIEEFTNVSSREEYLLCLVKVAGRELCQVIERDNKETQKVSQSAPLASYNAIDDWQSSSSIVKAFLNKLLSKDNSELFKVMIRNAILLVNRPRKCCRKPQSCYFISAVVKYLNDKQKILDFLSSLSIGVGDSAIANLEKKQVNEFNKHFWTIPDSASVMTVMDNNQADFGTKNYNPLNDSHHVDGLNVLQVVKPTGNINLNRRCRSLDELDESFIECSSCEKVAGECFQKCFNALLLSVNDIQPSDSLKAPDIQDIIPVSDLTVKFLRNDGNVLKKRLLEVPKYAPYNLTDPEDPDISWSNSKGSKTSLRYLKIGKSTDDHVFLDCLSFLHSTFKTNEREKIFVTLDQALHFKFKSLITQGKMPQEYVDFFYFSTRSFPFPMMLAEMHLFSI